MEPCVSNLTSHNILPSRTILYSADGYDALITQLEGVCVVCVCMLVLWYMCVCVCVVYICIYVYGVCVVCLCVLVE